MYFIFTRLAKQTKYNLLTQHLMAAKVQKPQLSSVCQQVDKTRHDKIRQNMTRQNRARQDRTGQDKTKHDKTNQDKSRKKFSEVNGGCLALSFE